VPFETKRPRRGKGGEVCVFEGFVKKSFGKVGKGKKKRGERNQKGKGGGSTEGSCPGERDENRPFPLKKGGGEKKKNSRIL